jgi:hypothetical protein
MTLRDPGRCQVVPRSPDRGTGKTAGLQKSRKAFSQTSGPAGGPVHNRASHVLTFGKVSDDFSIILPFIILLAIQRVAR